MEKELSMVSPERSEAGEVAGREEVMARVETVAKALTAEASG